VGFENPKKIGERVVAGQPLIIMHYNDEKKAEHAEKMVLGAYRIEDKPVGEVEKLIIQRVF
jgi:thymidine phosphorylase